MAAVLAAAIYSRIGFSPCLAVRARHVMVPGGSVFHPEPGTIMASAYLADKGPYFNIFLVLLTSTENLSTVTYVVP